MAIFRSYFSKNNTLIEGNETNNSQNPVTEISYGGIDNQRTRYIFDVNLDNLRVGVQKGLITPKNALKHTLKMKNTISDIPRYIGKKSYNSSINRASSFNLELYEINEEWDEGSGYDFIYDDSLVKNPNTFPSNWYYRLKGVEWNGDGSYLSGDTKTIGIQHFENGSENLSIDVTEYINNLIGLNDLLDYSGTTQLSGETYGFGLKFTDEFEALETIHKQAVAFHGKHTNTWYEPHIETIIDDRLKDDRLFFYQDKENELYFYLNHKEDDDVVINSIKIYDYQNKLLEIISGDSISYVRKGVYKINYIVSSVDYPDGVLFRDEWDFTINGFNKTHIDKFYIMSSDNYYSMNRDTINFNNYFFSFSGISQGEKLKASGNRKIKLHIKDFYGSQDNNKPLNIDYRLYILVTKKHMVDVIPFTPVDRTKFGYEITLDTSWLLPEDYYLEIRMSDGDYSKTKESLKFTIISDDIFK